LDYIIDVLRNGSLVRKNGIIHLVNGRLFVSAKQNFIMQKLKS